MNVSECKVTIVGLGLIGGSIALGLVGKVAEVRGVDISEEILDSARKRQMADVLSISPEETIPYSDVVIVALYPKMTEQFIIKHRDLFTPGTIVIDVSSIKSHIVSKLQNIMPEGVEFLGTHPMAGREGRGIDKAREEMFLGSYYLLTPTEKNSERAVKLLGSLMELLGVRKIVSLSPTEHDALVSYTSQMPHVLASLLMNGFTESSKFLIGGSFKDATRVATINEDLWTELFIENKEHLLEEMDQFEKRWFVLKEAISEGNEKQIYRILKQAKELKEKI
ncbi:prephenate dehydrogenase [Clostridia bacterium]|nr:prephenate dehydrogenase [Clostridia bacterium]